MTSSHHRRCNASTCTDIRDIVFRNLTFVQSGSTGSVTCFPARPCQNITFDNVRVESVAKGTAQWPCEGVASGSFSDVYPPRLTTGNCNFTRTL
jgi:hypothetical protein